MVSYKQNKKYLVKNDFGETRQHQEPMHTAAGSGYAGLSESIKQAKLVLSHKNCKPGRLFFDVIKKINEVNAERTTDTKSYAENPAVDRMHKHLAHAYELFKKDPSPGGEWEEHLPTQEDAFGLALAAGDFQHVKSITNLFNDMGLAEWARVPTSVSDAPNTARTVPGRNGLPRAGGNSLGNKRRTRANERTPVYRPGQDDDQSPSRGQRGANHDRDMEPHAAHEHEPEVAGNQRPGNRRYQVTVGQVVDMLEAHGARLIDHEPGSVG
ncbi:hypothetical protein IMZ48_36950, partial [Candidatus Bathyarchaeota archaeon]|nr:hypothetical protein [Candidatus Bathyarchaeota archaeon]